MGLRASLGNSLDDSWEQLIGPGAFYCVHCDQAWLLLAVGENSGPHACKRCGEPLTRLIKGELVNSRIPENKKNRRIA